MDTIRCPRVLNLLNRRLPEYQTDKKQKSSKHILSESNGSENNPNVDPNNLRRIQSEREKYTRVLSGERRTYSPIRIFRQSPVSRQFVQHVSPGVNNHLVVSSSPQKHVLNAHNVIVGHNGYLKMPKVISYKILQ